MISILVINGVNLNQLGLRDQSHYGQIKLDDINILLKQEFPEVNFSFFQSNSETEIVNKIQNAEDFDAIVINPGAFTHTSVAIRDALESFKRPKIEVHLSNLSSRENFRNVMITTSQTDGYVSGLKETGYLAAVYSILKIISQKNIH
jgi:3-dehydroquinate dehydratase II